MKMKKLNLRKVAIAGALIAILAVGSAVAFFTDRDNTESFTVRAHLFICRKTITQ